MKRLCVLVVVLMVLSLPLGAAAQSQAFVVAYADVAFFETGLQVSFTANWFDVLMTCTVEEYIVGIYQYYGDNYTHIYQELYFWEMPVDYGESYEMILGFINGTRMHYDPDFSFEEPDCTLSLMFTVPHPSLVEAEVLPPEEIMPDPYLDDEVEPYSWVFDDEGGSARLGLIVLIAGFGSLFWVLMGEDNRRRRSAGVRRRRVASELASAGQVDTVVTHTYDYGDAGSEVAVEVELPTVLEVTGVLPGYSSLDDDADWRICPYCGEWTSGVSRRCINCGGRLGRPIVE